MFYQYLICKNKSVLCTLEAGLKTGCEIVNEDASLNCKTCNSREKLFGQPRRRISSSSETNKQQNGSLYEDLLVSKIFYQFPDLRN